MKGAALVIIFLASPAQALPRHAARHHARHPKRTPTPAPPSARAPTPVAPTAVAPSAPATPPAVAAAQRLPTAPVSPPAEPPRSSADPLNFDLLGSSQSPVLDPQEIARMDQLVYRRRVMLRLHSVVGIALLVATTANVVLGALNYYDRFGGGGYTNDYNLAHEVAAFTTLGLFSTNLVLGLAAPNPYARQIRADRMLLHRIFMFTAAAGFIAEAILGFVSVGHYGENDQAKFAIAHLINGTATSALVYAGAAVFVF